MRQQVRRPLNLTSCLLCCLCIYFSPQLNSLNPKSPPRFLLLHPPCPSLPSRPPARLLPPANKGGQIQYGSSEGGKKKRNLAGGVKSKPGETVGKNKRKKKNLKCLSHFFFPSFLFFNGSFSASLPARLVKVSAARRRGRPLLADVQLLTLLSPCKREEKAGVSRLGEAGEGRTNIVTARLCSTESRCSLIAVLATLMQCTHAHSRRRGQFWTY